VSAAPKLGPVDFIDVSPDAPDKTLSDTDSTSPPTLVQTDVPQGVLSPQDGRTTTFAHTEKAHVTQGLTRYGVPTEPISAIGFAPFGELLTAQPDGTAFTAAEAVLDLSAGVPRFYVMSLDHQRSTFTRITRHHYVTQCLAAVGGQPWWLAVAPACNQGSDQAPALGELHGFDVPGDVAVLLKRGTWHAGPFFATSPMAFFNLELSDTNIVDHDTSHLDDRFGVECHFERTVGHA
jgi:ureidoglycolate hydrolase